MYTKEIQDMVKSNLQQRREELKIAKGKDRKLIELDLKHWQSVDDLLAKTLANAIYLQSD